jgi:hypothetical protein
MSLNPRVPYTTLKVLCPKCESIFNVVVYVAVLDRSVEVPAWLILRPNDPILSENTAS